MGKGIKGTEKKPIRLDISMKVVTCGKCGKKLVQKPKIFENYWRTVTNHMSNTHKMKGCKFNCHLKIDGHWRKVDIEFVKPWYQEEYFRRYEMVKVNPAVANFPATGGTSTHEIVSGSESRLAFKIESSNNTEYRIRPEYGFIDSNDKLEFEIVRLNGAAGDDELKVYYIEVAGYQNDAKKVFEEEEALGVVVVKMNAV